MGFVVSAGKKITFFLFLGNQKFLPWVFGLMRLL